MDVPDAWVCCRLGDPEEKGEGGGEAGGGRQRGRAGRILVVASEAAGDPACDGRQQLDDGLSNPPCVFLFMFLAKMMLMIVIHSASTLPFCPGDPRR